MDRKLDSSSEVLTNTCLLTDELKVKIEFRFNGVVLQLLTLAVIFFLTKGSIH